LGLSFSHAGDRLAIVDVELCALAIEFGFSVVAASGARIAHVDCRRPRDLIHEE